MKRVICAFFLIGLFSCSTIEFPKKYALYQRDKSLNYPEEDLSIELINDTIGLFTNLNEGSEVFSQKFDFEKVNNDYLIIGNVSQINEDFISLSRGDTIVIDKKRLLFFYVKYKKYLLSFRRK